MVPRPVKAVVLVFPYGEARDRRRAEDERIAKEGGPNVDETVFWAKQTVRETLVPSFFCSGEIDDDQVPGACGTMALIHGLANVGILRLSLLASRRKHDLYLGFLFLFL
jgi:ubiquitin carboxyl-terminal hydrolase L3